MKTLNLLLTSAWLTILPAWAEVKVTEHSKDTMAKFYPDLVNSPDYLGGVLIINDTQVETFPGASSAIDVRGTTAGIALGFTLGSGYNTLRNMKDDCRGSNDNYYYGCALDVLHATVVHAGGAIIGNALGTSWVWANLAAQTRPAAAKSRVRRDSCPASDFFRSSNHFSANIGLKTTCKAGCLAQSYEQLLAAADLLRTAYPFSDLAESKNAGAFEFTVYKIGGDDDGKVFIRCHVVGQLDHPDVCPAEVSGSSCKV